MAISIAIAISLTVHCPILPIQLSSLAFPNKKINIAFENSI